jgi:hypothetical protein
MVKWRLMNENLLNTQAACEFLGVSRPTLNTYKEAYGITFQKKGKEHLFKKNELIAKVLSLSPPRGPTLDLVMTAESSRVAALKLDPYTYDLRQLNLIDGYGMFALMADMYESLQVGCEVNLILDSEFSCRYLCEAKFFTEIRRQFPKNIYLNQEPEKLILTPNVDSFLPLTKVGFKNAEQAPLETDVVPILKNQGFSETIAGYIFWIVGELMDNAHTHAQAKGNCYIAIHRFGADRKYLQIDVCDIGVGIPTTLKTKPEHQSLTDRHALARAFRSRVSSWPNEAQRGKGLSDVLGVAIGAQSFLRIESGGEGMLMIFAGEGKHARLQPPLTAAKGTRISLTLIDQQLRTVSREESDKFTEEVLEKICTQ